MLSEAKHLWTSFGGDRDERSEILRFAQDDKPLHSATTATKSRTAFRPEIENALPSSRANQNALEEPPSRFIARRIFESATMGARGEDVCQLGKRNVRANAEKGEIVRGYSGKGSSRQL